jgi:hypothetical protein
LFIQSIKPIIKLKSTVKRYYAHIQAVKIKEATNFKERKYGTEKQLEERGKGQKQKPIGDSV